MNIALRDNFQRSVEKLNLNQFPKFEVYKREYIFLSMNDLIIKFLGRNI